MRYYRGRIFKLDFGQTAAWGREQTILIKYYYIIHATTESKVPGKKSTKRRLRFGDDSSATGRLTRPD